MTSSAFFLISSTLILAWACGREEKTPAPPVAPAAGPVVAPVAPIKPPAPGLKGLSKGPPAHDHGAHGKDHKGHRHGESGPGDLHKPFSDNALYIRHLEREERATWQKPDEVVAALKLTGDETVVDFGAGSGYFTFRLARALPRGKVVAVDVEADMVAHLGKRAAEEKVSNVTVQRVAPDAAPAFPPDTGLVFVADVLHHVPKRDAWLKTVASGLRSGARLALIEFRMGPLPAGPPDAMKIPRAELVKLATDAGLTLSDDLGKLLPYQEFLVFCKP